MELRIIHAIYIFLLSSSLLAQDCGPSQAITELSINNTKVTFGAIGDLWSDDGHYVVPQTDNPEDEVSAIYGGGLWLSSSSGAAIALYPSGNVTDFWTGPIQEDGTSDMANCENWDRFFEVLKTDVEAHITDFEGNGVIDNKRAAIFGWPGRNNNSFEEINGFEILPNKSLAPFMDLNENGDYEPEKGEYPLIKGDQSIWWVFNDVGNTHLETGASPLSVEVQAMAYGYKSQIESLNNSTFYDFKIINQGSVDIQDLYVGLWVAPELGYGRDDYIGYDEERHMGFIYNEDADDSYEDFQFYGEEIPMVGVSLLNSSFDKDENSSFSILTSSPTSYSKQFPLNGSEVHDLLGNKNPVTNPITNQLADYAFPGEPSDSTSWSMCTDSISFPPLRSFLISNGGLDLPPKQSVEMTYAVLYVADVPHPCPSLEPLQDVYDEISKGGLFTSVKRAELESRVKLNVRPTLSAGTVLVEATEPIKGRLVVSDVLGEIVLEKKLDSNRISLDLSSYNAGLYFITIIADDQPNIRITEKVVLMR